MFGEGYIISRNKFQSYLLLLLKQFFRFDLSKHLMIWWFYPLPIYFIINRCFLISIYIQLDDDDDDDHDQIEWPYKQMMRETSPNLNAKKWLISVKHFFCFVQIKTTKFYNNRRGGEHNIEIWEMILIIIIIIISTWLSSYAVCVCSANVETNVKWLCY